MHECEFLSQYIPIHKAHINIITIYKENIKNKYSYIQSNFLNQKKNIFSSLTFQSNFFMTSQRKTYFVLILHLAAGDCAGARFLLHQKTSLSSRQASKLASSQEASQARARSFASSALSRGTMILLGGEATRRPERRP